MAPEPSLRADIARLADELRYTMAHGQDDEDKIKDLQKRLERLEKAFTETQKP